MKNDGGPAFPLDTRRESAAVTDCTKLISGTTYHGMSLRDWFAGMALSGELASASTHDSADAIARASVEAGLTVEAHIARTCYQMADLMLAERNK